MLAMLESGDSASQLLIAQLLTEDLRVAEEARQLEQAQLTQTLADSARFSGTIPQRVLPSVAISDAEIALAMLAADVRVSSDAAFAQALQHSDDAASIASRQYAQQLLAAEKKIALDSEFARRLQQMENAGEGKVDPTYDAERVLGVGEIERILAHNPNEKGKGKAVVGRFEPNYATRFGKRFELDDDDDDNDSILFDLDEDEQQVPLGPECAICMEPFQLVHSPVNAAKYHPVASSKKLPFGLSIPCPGSHKYCQACLASYIKLKIDPDNDGSGNPNTVVFPIRCPECSIVNWESGITDDIATRVLSEKDMITWHHQRILDSLPRIYCPNKQCSALVQVHDDPNEPQAECPVCNTLMCVPCRVQWHANYTCEEYQDLPLDERAPEDQQALQLMRAQHWRRCPQCKIIVELTSGCHHITCRCGSQFCFKCGSKWDIQKRKCTRNPTCDLWDEEMLLEEQERERVARALPPGQGAFGMFELRARGALLPHYEPRGQAPAFAPPAYQPAPAPILHRHHGNNGPEMMHWMMEPGGLRTKHMFTRGMVASLDCGYCNARLNSLADLRYHLAHTSQHEVWACCGRFFKRENDFDKHVSAKWFEHHENQVVRENGMVRR